MYASQGPQHVSIHGEDLMTSGWGRLVHVSIPTKRSDFKSSTKLHLNKRGNNVYLVHILIAMYLTTLVHNTNIYLYFIYT